jgi:hypothetical protein
MNWKLMAEIATVLGGLAAIPAIIAAIYLGYRWSFNKGYKRAKNEILENHDRQQFRKIYAPLRSLLLDIQVTSASSIRYPYLPQRIKRAIRLVRNGRFKNSITAIVDKGISGPSAEIEFGPGFPLSKIKAILTSHAPLADPEIMDLYQRVERSQYEGGRGYENELLPEELELFDHIIDKYGELSKRFG